METNFEKITEYEVPIVFAEGRHDYHVSSALVEEYYNRIRSKKRLVWFEHSCHFPQWSESAKFNQLLNSFESEKI